MTSAADGGQTVDNVTWGELGLVAHACRANRVELRRFIRRIGDGVIAENQGKARLGGDLRVALFPSKHSRVRIPSPALEAEYRIAQPPTGRPTSRANPFF